MSLFVASSEDNDAMADAMCSPTRRSLKLNIPTVSHSALIPEELVTLLSTSPSTLVLVDVRSSDFAGGHLKGSITLPFDSINDATSFDTLFTRIESNGSASVLFVCMSGKQRSPVAAELFLARWREANGNEIDPPRTYVLASGFTGLLNEVSTITNDAAKSVVLSAAGASIIDGFDASKWTPVAATRTPSNAAVAAGVPRYQAAYRERL